MKRPRPPVTTEVTLSYRRHDVAGYCAYVTVVRYREGRTPSVLVSEHLAGPPERLVDLATARARELSFEWFLVDVEPF